MEKKRLRLVFKDGEILSDAQKSEGLARCWVLLKPQEIGTVSDLISHLLDLFQLRKSCPHGLILSTSGFVLPPFESSSILECNEIIRVTKKKAPTLCLEDDRASNEVEKVKDKQRKLVDNGVLLLEFEKQKGGFQVEDAEEDFNEVDEELDPSTSRRGSKSQKRKADDKLLHPKKKKKVSEATGSAAENGAPTGNMVDSSSNKRDNSDREDNPQNNTEHANVGDKDDIALSNIKRCRHSDVEDNDKGTPDTKPTPTKKGPSRSARRKYAKRRWLREMAKIKQNTTSESEGLKNWKEDQSKAKGNKRNWEKNLDDPVKDVQDDGPRGLLHWKPSSQNGKLNDGKKRGWNKERLHKPLFYADDADKGKNQLSGENSQPTIDWSGLESVTPEKDDVDEQPAPKNSALEGHQNSHAPGTPNESSDEENEVVPVMIRPGHIRFEPLGKGVEEALLEDHVSLETYSWNGITNKKKGQKWGKEDRSFTRQNSYNNSDLPPSKKEKEYEDLDFEKLPIHGIPEEGDIVAFRELELSSNMTPEISNYRVGKVLSFDVESKNAVLQPVPGHPFIQKKTADDENSQPDDSFENQDGPLQVDYSTLLDVRLVSRSSGPHAKCPRKLSNGCAGNENASSSQTVEAISGVKESEHCKGALLAETGIWEQLSEAVAAKKEQLSQNQWNRIPEKKENPAADIGGNRSWSFKALRGSGLGPTMALLRSSKNL